RRLSSLPALLRPPRRLGGGAGGDGGDLKIRLQFPHRRRSRPLESRAESRRRPGLFPPSPPYPHNATCAGGAGVGLIQPRPPRPLRPFRLPAPHPREAARSPAPPKSPRCGAARRSVIRNPSLLPALAPPAPQCANLRDARGIVSGPGAESPSSPRSPLLLL